MNKLLVDTQDDLHRRFDKHNLRVRTFWRRFNQEQRVECLKGHPSIGRVLENSSDKSNELLYKFAPEINLHDLTERGPDILYGLLRHRAYRQLLSQYCQGFNGEAGDHAYILLAMRTKDLRPTDHSEQEYVLFANTYRYGNCYELQQSERIRTFKKELSAKTLIPRSIGELVLQRQLVIIHALNCIMEEVLYRGSRTKDQSHRMKKSDVIAENSFATLNFNRLPIVSSLAGLVSRVDYQKLASEGYTRLLITSPVALAYTIEGWMHTRPELIEDKDGGPVRLSLDKHNSTALYDIMHQAWKVTAIWRYISKLVNLLESVEEDKVYKKIVLQELVNVCYYEFERSRAFFKRHVQSQAGKASQWFYRGSKKSEYDDEIRIKMRSKSKGLKKSDLKLYYILRLCDAKNDIKKAITLMKKLNSTFAGAMWEVSELKEREHDALGEIQVIVALYADLGTVFPLPSFSRKHVTTFIPMMQEIDDLLEKYRNSIDLNAYVAPKWQILEPGNATIALGLLHRHVGLCVGVNTKILYETPVEAGVQDLESCYRDKTAKLR